MRDALQVMDRCIGRYLDGLCNPARPVDVRLNDVQCAGVDESFEAPARVLVLSARERDSRAGPDLRVGVDAVRHGRLFKPARVELLDLFRHLLRVGQVPAEPAVEHDVVIVAHRFPERAHQLYVLLEALRPIHRPVAEEPLLRPVSLRLVLECALADQGRVFHVEAEHAGICRDLGTCRSAEQADDGRVVDLAAQVPEGAVDGADRHHRLALASVDRGSEHLVPEQLVCGRVLALDDLAQRRGDYVGLGAVDRPTDASDAAIGLDLHKS